MKQYSCGQIQFGNAEGKRVVILGEGRRSLFRHIREHGVLPEGWTLLAEHNGGPILPISYEEIDWSTVGDLGKPRGLGGLQNGYRGVPIGFGRNK